MNFVALLLTLLVGLFILLGSFIGLNYKDNKSMLIKITDERLLEKTGGIIQRNEWLSNNSKW